MLLSKRIENIAASYVQKKKNALLSIGIVLEGEHYTYHYGNHPIATKVDPSQVVYEIGSISKVFTTYVLACMQEQGKLNEKDRAAAHWNDIEQYCPITLEQLATHTSGLPSFNLIREIYTLFTPHIKRDPYCLYSLEELKAYINDKKYPNQSKFSYSNVGMGLLGQIMAWHAGCSYEQLVHVYITQPLAMKRTCINVTDACRSNVIPGHHASGKPAKPLVMEHFQGAGAILSTVEDLLIFLEMHMHADEGHIAARTHQARGKVSKSLFYGLGWLRDNDMIFHNGATTGYSSFLAFDKKHKHGVVVLSNYRNRIIQDSPDRIALDIMSALRQMHNS